MIARALLTCPPRLAQPTLRIWPVWRAPRPPAGTASLPLSALSSLSVRRLGGPGGADCRASCFVIATRTMTSSASFPTLPNIELCSDLQSTDYDGLVVVSHSVADLPFDDLQRPLAAITAIDKKAEDGLFITPCHLPAKRIIYSSTGKLDQDCDDVRRYAEAAEKGVARAIEAGCQSPCLLFNVKSQFPQAGIVAALGGLKALYVPLEMREAQPDKAKKVAKIGIFGSEDRVGAKIELVRALETGRIVSRDVGGSDPERMAAPRVEEYIRQTFENSGIKIEVIQGQPTFEQDYPCFAAVNRCASSIPRHDGRIIWLTYEPEGPVEKTLMLVGKGVTYDTGGLDIKAGGECDGKIEIISVACGLKLHSENLAAQEIAETIRKMNIRLLFNICGFPHKEHQKSADDISMTPQIGSFLTFHSKIALTSQLIFEMLVQSQRNENGSTVFNIGAYYPNFGSQDWTEFKALQSYGTGLQQLSERDGAKSRLNIVGVQYINYFTRIGSADSSIWSSYMGYLLPTAKSYATSLLAKLERGREHQLAVSWRHSMIMGILNLCPYLYFPPQ